MAGIDPAVYQLLSPASGDARSSLVVLTHRNKDRNQQVHQALRAAGVDIALRAATYASHRTCTTQALTLNASSTRLRISGEGAEVLTGSDQPLGQPWHGELRGRLDRLVVDSQVLRGNPLGDPHVRPLYVYQPTHGRAGPRCPRSTSCSASAARPTCG